MIKNFSKETIWLSPREEKELLPNIVAVLNSHKGKSQAITNRQIIALFDVKGKEGEARIRKVINYIRNSGIIPCLIASGKGYYIATDAKDITDYEESLRGRVSAIHKMRQSIHRQGVEIFGEDAIKAAEAETRSETAEEQKKLKRSL